MAGISQNSVLFIPALNCKRLDALAKSLQTVFSLVEIFLCLHLLRISLSIAILLLLNAIHKVQGSYGMVDEDCLQDAERFRNRERIFFAHVTLLRLLTRQTASNHKMNTKGRDHFLCNDVWSIDQDIINMLRGKISKLQIKRETERSPYNPTH